MGELNLSFGYLEVFYLFLLSVQKHHCSTWLVTQIKSWLLIGRFQAYCCQAGQIISLRYFSMKTSNLTKSKTRKLICWLCI